MTFKWKYENDEKFLNILLAGLIAHAEILEDELRNYADYFEENHAPEIAAILRIQFLNMATGLPELAWGIDDILRKNELVESNFVGGYDEVKEAKEGLEDYRKELGDRMNKLKENEV
jgi:hypothetical protein